MQYRHSDYGKRGRSSSRSSGQGREAASNFFSIFWVAVNFLLAIFAITAFALVTVGWLRFVAFGKVPNQTYWKRLTYDVIHITDQNSQNRMKRFVRSVVQTSDGSAPVF